VGEAHCGGGAGAEGGIARCALLSDLYIRLRSLFCRARSEKDLDEEFRFHLDHQVEKYMAAGIGREEAMRRVRLEFGGVDQIKKQCRDARGHHPRYGLQTGPPLRAENAMEVVHARGWLCRLSEPTGRQ
jgi:hypothetical protein